MDQDRLTEKEKKELQYLLNFVLKNKSKRTKSQNPKKEIKKGNYKLIYKPQENAKLREFLLKYNYFSLK